jgi:hypothetical protein
VTKSVLLRGSTLAVLAASLAGCAETVQVRPVLSGPPRPTAGTREVAPVASDVVVLTTGADAPRFRLPDLVGQERSLDELLASGHVVVLEWVDPTSRAWRDQHRRRGDLHRAFQRFDPRGVGWVGICSFDPRADGAGGRVDGDRLDVDVGRPGPLHPRQGSRVGRLEPPGRGTVEPRTRALLPFSEVEARRRCRAATNELGLRFPILLDRSGEVARAYGVRRAPHVVAIDRQGRVVFQGRPEPVKPPPPTPLTRALSSLLGGDGPGPTSIPSGTPSPLPTTPAPPLPVEGSPDDEIEEKFVGEEEPEESDPYDDYDIEETYLDEEDP